MLKLTIDAATSARFEKVLTEAPERVKAACGIIVLRLANEIRNEAGTLAPYKSGNLRRSLTAQPVGNDKTKYAVGTNLVYAEIHDKGGVVKPSRGKYLAIPLGGIKGGPRKHPGGFFIRSKRGNLLYVKKSGDGIQPLHVLKTNITIKKTKGRGYLTPAFEHARIRAPQIVKEELTRVLQ